MRVQSWRGSWYGPVRPSDTGATNRERDGSTRVSAARRRRLWRSQPMEYTLALQGSPQVECETGVNRVPYLATSLGVLLAAVLAGQPGETFVDTIDVQGVEVDAVVTDRRGRPVSGLQREDFELSVDGEFVEIANFYEATVFGERVNGANDRGASTQGVPASTNESPFTVVLYLDDANVLRWSRFLGQFQGRAKVYSIG